MEPFSYELFMKLSLHSQAIKNRKFRRSQLISIKKILTVISPHKSAFAVFNKKLLLPKTNSKEKQYDCFLSPLRLSEKQRKENNFIEFIELKIEKVHYDVKVYAFRPRNFY
jgi:hypothetical protein